MDQTKINQISNFLSGTYIVIKDGMPYRCTIVNLTIQAGSPVADIQSLNGRHKRSNVPLTTIYETPAEARAALETEQAQELAQFDAQIGGQ